MSEEISRRQFLKSGAMSALGLMVVPSSVLGKAFGHVAPSDKLNIAVVGIGGMGHANINAVKETENIVALCDVNWNYAKGVFDEFPKAKRYWDYRKMFDEMGGNRRRYRGHSRPYPCDNSRRRHDYGQTCVRSEASDPFGV